jgi:hypothetical protein
MEKDSKETVNQIQEVEKAVREKRVFVECRKDGKQFLTSTEELKVWDESLTQHLSDKEKDKALPFGKLITANCPVCRSTLIIQKER